MPDTTAPDGDDTASVQTGLLQTIPLYIGFTGTGVCCALMGVLLPTLLAKWRMNDHAGGVLFLLIWMGSSLGALLVWNALRFSAAVGCASIALASGALAYFGKELSSPLMLLYGVGLGLTMTSISLIRQHTKAKARSVELVRLNLVWAIGACACPLLVSYSLRSGSPAIPLLAVAVFFALLSLLSLLVVSNGERLPRKGGLALPTWTIFRHVPLQLILMTVLCTGIEASGGSWLATYAHRSQPGILFTVAAPTCLWAGLLLSRFLGSFPEVERLMRSWALIFVALVVISTVALASTVHGGALLLASLLLGFGLGPLYPIFLARVLTFQQGGAIFFLAGISSAVMPWMTGVLSTRFASLSAGMIVPAVGAVLLLILGIVSQSSALNRSSAAS